MTPKEMEENLKKAILIAHNNTHSTSRILRNVKIIRDIIKDENEIIRLNIEARLQIFEKCSLECRSQVDEMYRLIKNKNI